MQPMPALCIVILLLWTSAAERRDFPLPHACHLHWLILSHMIAITATTEYFLPSYYAAQTNLSAN